MTLKVLLICQIHDGSHNDFNLETVFPQHYKSLTLPVSEEMTVLFPVETVKHLSQTRELSEDRTSFTRKYGNQRFSTIFSRKSEINIFRRK